MEDEVKSPARRSFLRTSAVAAAGLATAASAKKVMGANDRIRIAVVGLHGRGWDHVRGYKPIPGVEIAYFCDCDENVLRQRLAQAEQLGIPKPQTYVDIRKLLDDKNVDAISIATPNHWHSLMGIWAAQAKKDFYIEKPCSHNLWEGRQLVNAVQKYKVICQHGSQCRSSAAIREAMDQMKSGLLGDLYMSRGLCFKWRDTIGHAEPEPVPAGVNYDLWTGPAPMRQFTKNRFHYNWHWIWDTGNGDLGNQGIHEVDLARWGLGVTLPTKITAIGGHFLFDDDQQTPNAISVAYEFDGPNQKKKMMTFEVRGWMTNHEAEIGTAAFRGGDIPAAGLKPVSMVQNAQPKRSTGIAQGKPGTIGNLYYGSKGYIAVSGYDSYKSFLGDQNEPGPEKREPVRNEHFVNFIDCMRSRDANNLHAPILEGHLSAALVHLGNASYRLGRTINFDPEKEAVINDKEATTLLHGTYRAPYTVPKIDV
ncbi:MAG TPA: Gfo/Idh/MocA family oxidoreductase [Bryobacteraceae bacterium]|nr:Gfo/Idh/MocA family oxidoreductase [Bryobacteraceae bacterium]